MNDFDNFTKKARLNQFDFIDISLTDILDILLVALLLFYLYKLVKGTVAINIFIGIVIIYFIWKITDLFKLDVLSNILGNFISVGFFALIVVFQQEIRKFLLLIGSTNFASRRNVVKYFNFLNQDKSLLKLDLSILLSSCEKMASEKTGSVFKRYSNLFREVFQTLPIETIHSVTLGVFRMPKRFFQSISNLYPEEPLFSSPLSNQSSLITYDAILEKQLLNFCMRELTNFIEPERVFSCEIQNRKQLDEINYKLITKK